MKITFILPAIGKKPGQKYIGTWKMEPLTVAVLQALTPPDVETELFDDRLEQIDYDTKTDLVAITVETYTARRAYAIAEKYRARGIPAVLGGYHVTMLPDEAAEHGDSIIVGNAEPVWAAMVADARAGRLKKRYDGAPGFGPRPDRRIFAGKRYLPVTLLETGRGCCHSCDFCVISRYYGCRYYRRDHEQILADVRESRRKYHFLVDDNLMADRDHAMALFRRLAPEGIKWAGQGTLSMGRDEELLKAMKKSGCELILIGFESLCRENLAQMNKSFNETAGRRDELVRRIHDAGIGIYATFVFGYDYDTPETIADAVAFSRRHKFYTAAFNHLLPFPNTPLYSRLQRENRLRYDKWWLAEGYRYGEAAFTPKRMTAQELSALCRDARKAFSAPRTVLSRGLSAMGRTTPALWWLFWGMNLRLGEEVDEKMNVPIGENLDELPK